MHWINVKDGLPEEDCVCVVHNDSRPFQFYISVYNAYFKEFEVNMIGCTIRLPDPITFNATHWIKLDRPLEKVDELQ